MVAPVCGSTSYSGSKTARRLGSEITALATDASLEGWSINERRMKQRDRRLVIPHNAAARSARLSDTAQG